MEHHKKFLHSSLSGTVLKSKLVRTLTELKVLVYEFSEQAALLDVQDSGDFELETPRHAGTSQILVLKLQLNFDVDLKDVSDYCIEVGKVCPGKQEPILSTSILKI